MPNGNVSNGDNVLFTFTSEEGVTINVYDACTNGSCNCIHVLGGEPTQLKPCRLVYLYSLATTEGRNAFSPLISSIVDGFKVMDGSQENENISYDCKNYKSVFEDNNKVKLDKIIGSELSEGYLKIVDKKPKCIHGIRAVPNQMVGSDPSLIAVNNFCEGIIQDFKYKSVDDVLSILQPNDYFGVIDIKSAYRAVYIHPSKTKYIGLRWELNDKTIYIEDSRLCFCLSVGPMAFDNISNFVYSVLTDIQSNLDIQHFLVAVKLCQMSNHVGC